MDDFFKKIKDMNMPSLDKKDVINNMMLYLASMLNVRSKMDIGPYELGQIKILIQSIETMYIIGIRSGFKIKIDGHSVVHQQAEMDELKKLVKDYEDKLFGLVNA